MRLLLGMSGASGVVYGVRLLEVLQQLPQVETHLVMTPAARETISLETGRDPREVDELAGVVHRFGDIAAGPASEYAIADNLLVRAADVALKERRPLIVAPRETPLHLGHLRSMVRLAELGAVIAPPMPAFYHRPEAVSDIVDQTVNRLLDLLGLELPEDLFRRWRGARAEARGQRGDGVAAGGD